MSAPIKFTKKSEIFPILVIILSFIAGIYFYNKSPDVVASHWNFAGQVDGYSGKTVGAFALPILLAVIYILFLIMPTIDPRKNRYTEFSSVYHIFRNIIIFVLFIVYISSGLYNLGFPVAINHIVPFAIGCMMFVLGNYMGKIKPNYFMGIRTPWTLASDVVWNKTHRMGGYFFILFGLTIIISPFLNPTLGISIFIGGAIITTLGTMIYSYICFRQDNKKNLRRQLSGDGD
jgi:uncharacterized membrane protein